MRQPCLQRQAITREDEDGVSDVHSNHGSGIPDLDERRSRLQETLSQDWNLELLERELY